MNMSEEGDSSVNERLALLNIVDRPASVHHASDDDLPPSYESQIGSTRPPIRLAGDTKDGKIHILLGACGAVTLTKLPDLVNRLAERTPDGVTIAIRIVLTEASLRFPIVRNIHELPNVEGVYTDADEIEASRRGREPVYQELQNWADFVVVAPLTANTLSKIAMGISDNLLTAIIRSLMFEGKIEGFPKYLILCPAMDISMWSHSATKSHLHILQQDWADFRKFRKPQDKLIPGQSTTTTRMKPWATVINPVIDPSREDSGYGALMDWQNVVEELRYQLKKFV